MAQIGYFWMWRGSFKALRNVSTDEPAPDPSRVSLTLQTHKEILTVMLGATMPYFSKTRAGSILQRFGRDLDDITSASRLIYSMSTRIITSRSSRLCLLRQHFRVADNPVCVTAITVTLYGGWPFALATFVMLALMYKPVSPVTKAAAGPGVRYAC